VSRRVTWPRLLPGLVISGIIALGVAGVFAFARVGDLRGAKARLYATVSSSRGVLAGTEVWLSGQRIGIVRGVEFQSVQVDTAERLVIVFDVLPSVIRQLRRDSYAQIRPGGTLIGANVVYLTIGTPGAPPIAEGDTMRSRPQGGFESIASGATVAMRELPMILADLKLMRAQLTSARSTVGAFIGADIAAARELDALGTRAGALGDRVGARTAAIGRMMGRDVGPSVRHTMAGIDSLRLLLSDSTRYAVGRFRRDSTLATTVASLQREVARAGERVSRGDGIMARAGADSAVARELGQMSRELGALVVDIKRRPLRYLAF
jgi:MlaD protein